MALSRSYLEGLGLEEKQIKAIVEANSDSVNAVKAQMQAEINDLKTQLADANKKYDDKPSYKDEFDKIKDEFEQYKNDIANKAVETAKRDAYKKILKEAGISDKRFEAILKVTDLKDLKIGEDGALEDSEKLTESVKTEWADFVVKETVKGANPATPPKGGSRMSKEEILKIEDKNERQQKIAENLDLFGYSN